MKAREFVLIYFKTVRQHNQLKAKKNSAKKSQHAAKENEFTPEQRKKTAAKQTWQIHCEPVMQVVSK